MSHIFRFKNILMAVELLFLICTVIHPLGMSFWNLWIYSFSAAVVNQIYHNHLILDLFPKVFYQSSFRKYLICVKHISIIRVSALQLSFSSTTRPPPCCIPQQTNIHTHTHTCTPSTAPLHTPLSPSLHFHKWRETALSRKQHGKAIKKELRVCREKLDMISDAYCKCQRYYCVVVSCSFGLPACFQEWQAV